LDQAAPESYLACGLCNEAVKLGYHALFSTIIELIQTIRFKEVTTATAMNFKRLVHEHLLFINDIKIFSIENNNL
jgi:hypothetical protein